MITTITCNKFVCEFHRNGICKLSDIPCTSVCRGFNSVCENCVQSGCKKSKVNSKPQNIKEESVKVGSIEPYAYVDGSFLNGIYGYGGIVVGPDGTKHTLQGKGNDKDLAEMRNVAGEVLGAMKAIQYAIDNKFPSLKIYYDYIGIEKWAKNEWRANKPGTIAYKEFTNKCPIPLFFVKVKGHSGVKGNELADRLAKEAVGAA